MNLKQIAKQSVKQTMKDYGETIRDLEKYDRGEMEELREKPLTITEDK